MATVYNLPIQSAQTFSPQKLENTFLSGNVGYWAISGRLITRPTEQFHPGSKHRTISAR